jgi:hypothetical protein
MIVRYSSGHIFRYPHPELSSPIVKFVIFSDLFHFILFSLSVVTFAFHSSPNLHPNPCTPMIIGWRRRDRWRVRQQHTFSLLHQRSLLILTHAHTTTLVHCGSICGTLVAYYHCHLIDGLYSVS